MNSNLRYSSSQSRSTVFDKKPHGRDSNSASSGSSHLAVHISPPSHLPNSPCPRSTWRLRRRRGAFRCCCSRATTMVEGDVCSHHFSTAAVAAAVKNNGICHLSSSTSRSSSCTSSSATENCPGLSHHGLLLQLLLLLSLLLLLDRAPLRTRRGSSTSECFDSDGLSNLSLIWASR